VAKLVEGLVEEEGGRTFQDIACERDRLIVAMLKATRGKRKLTSRRGS
jgi:hypothetical protein